MSKYLILNFTNERKKRCKKLPEFKRPEIFRSFVSVKINSSINWSIFATPDNLNTKTSSQTALANAWKWIMQLTVNTIKQYESWTFCISNDTIHLMWKIKVYEIFQENTNWKLVKKFFREYFCNKWTH